MAPCVVTRFSAALHGMAVVFGPDWVKHGLATPSTRKTTSPTDAGFCTALLQINLGRCICAFCCLRAWSAKEKSIIRQSHLGDDPKAKHFDRQNDKMPNLTVSLRQQS